MTRTIPAPEQAHPPYADVLARKATLDAAIAQMRVEAAGLRQRLLQHGDAEARADRVAAIAAGTPYEDPAPLRDRLDALLRDLRDAEDALTLVLDRMGRESQAASRIVSAMYAEEHKAMLGRLWRSVAEGTKARLEIDELHRDLRRAGVEPTGIKAAGDAIFDEPMTRASNAATELRKAARDGIIRPSDIPEVLR